LIRKEAGVTGTPINQIKIVDVEAQGFVGARCGLVQQPPEGPVKHHHVVARPKRRDLLACQRAGAVDRPVASQR